MISHTEDIKRVVSVEREAGEGFDHFRVAVITGSGIRKTLRIPHYWADFLRNMLECEIGLMPDSERRQSWQASAPGRRAA